jgi:catechol 2,3-dioxygenase-like lactoylglutathione lyase family enzyme
VSICALLIRLKGVLAWAGHATGGGTVSEIEFTAAIPVLPSRDVPASIAFYRDNLGFEVAYEMDGYAIVLRGAAELHLNGFAEWPAAGRPETLARINLRGVDVLYSTVDAGIVHPDEELKTMPHGMRQFGIVDPSGNRVTFAERV